MPTDLVTLASMHCEPVLVPGASPMTADVDVAARRHRWSRHRHCSSPTWMPLAPPVTVVEAVAADGDHPSAATAAAGTVLIGVGLVAAGATAGADRQAGDPARRACQ